MFLYHIYYDIAPSCLKGFLLCNVRMNNEYNLKNSENVRLSVTRIKKSNESFSLLLSHFGINCPQQTENHHHINSLKDDFMHIKPLLPLWGTEDLILFVLN